MENFECMICGRKGSVGRCCSNELREPLTREGFMEQQKSLSSRKSYHDLNDVEKFVINEYISWKRSETDEIGYKMENLQALRLRATNLGIEHLL